MDNREYRHALIPNEVNLAGYPAVDMTKLGVLRGIRNLNTSCTVCGGRADYDVSKTDYPKVPGYSMAAKRTFSYCHVHLPEEARGLWQKEISNMPVVNVEVI